jgi:hypothetical protein
MRSMSMFTDALFKALALLLKVALVLSDIRNCWAKCNNNGLKRIGNSFSSNFEVVSCRNRVLPGSIMMTWVAMSIKRDHSRCNSMRSLTVSSENVISMTLGMSVSLCAVSGSHE